MSTQGCPVGYESPMSISPLQRVQEGQLVRLYEALWSWEVCECGYENGPCDSEKCTAGRSTRLRRYAEHYQKVTATYESDTTAHNEQALSNHEDLAQIIILIKANVDLDRKSLTLKAFANRPSRRLPSQKDQDRAMDLAIKSLAMINSFTPHLSPEITENDACRMPWTADASFRNFCKLTFPRMDHPILNDPEASLFSDVKASLRARKLQKVLGLKLCPTDDLRNHLRLDWKSSSLYIFHHTAFLKEHLRMTIGLSSAKEADEEDGAALDDLTARSITPRQLALEVLDSIQKILFPLADSKSAALLLSLTTTASFDPDALRFESTAIRGPNEREISYYYFGARLAELYEAVRNPRPRGWFAKWAERKSAGRHIMIATLFGVMFALLLGFASLAVAGYQAWLTYQQWKHPIQSP